MIAMGTLTPPPLNKNKQESIKKGLLSELFQSLESSDFPMPKLISPWETTVAHPCKLLLLS